MISELSRRDSLGRSRRESFMPEALPVFQKSPLPPLRVGLIMGLDGQRIIDATGGVVGHRAAIIEPFQKASSPPLRAGLIMRTPYGEIEIDATDGVAERGLIVGGERKFVKRKHVQR